MKHFLKVILIVFSTVAGVIMALVGFSYWLQKQLDEVFGDINNLDFEEEETGVVPEVVKSKSEGG